MPTKTEATDLLDAAYLNIKNGVKAAVEISRAVRITGFNVVKWNEDFVGGYNYAQKVLLRNWYLLRKRKKHMFPTILNCLEERAQRVCDLHHKLQQKVVYTSPLSLEDMLKAIRLLQRNIDGAYVENQFGKDDKRNNPLFGIQIDAWESIKESSTPHTLGLTDILELRDALENLRKVLWRSSLHPAYRSWKGNEKQLDENDLLLGVVPFYWHSLISDILIDFSPFSLLSFLGDEEEVRDVVNNLEKGLENFKEWLTEVKEKDEEDED